MFSPTHGRTLPPVRRAGVAGGVLLAVVCGVSFLGCTVAPRRAPVTFICQNEKECNFHVDPNSMMDTLPLFIVFAEAPESGPECEALAKQISLKDQDQPSFELGCESLCEDEVQQGAGHFAGLTPICDFFALEDGYTLRAPEPIHLLHHGRHELELATYATSMLYTAIMDVYGVLSGALIAVSCFYCCRPASMDPSLGTEMMS